MFFSSRLHAYTRKRYDYFIRAVHSRVQGCKKSLSLHLWPLLFIPSCRPSSSYRNHLSVWIGITSSKESQKGFGKSPDCGAGSMTAWKYIFGYCHVPAVKVADFAHEMKRMWNAPVLKTRIGLSKRIMGSTYLLGHFLSVFTQFSQRSLRYKLVTAWHFSIILNHFLKMRLRKSELLL